MEQLQNTLALCFLLVFLVRVTPSPSQDASVLCISECGTCPLICSPPPSRPPSPSVVSKPPPSVQPKPPQSPKPGDSEPPPYLTPIYHTTPPQSYSPPPNTPPPRPPAKSCPPPSYITMGTNAPPPPPKLVVVPSTQIQPDDGMGQKNYSYPYYYFYTSKGVAFSQVIPGLLILFICFHFIFLFIG